MDADFAVGWLPQTLLNVVPKHDFASACGQRMRLPVTVGVRSWLLQEVQVDDFTNPIEQFRQLSVVGNLRIVVSLP